MGWLGKRRRKKEEKEEEAEAAAVEEQGPVATGPDVLVLVPEVAGAPTFAVNSFASADDAIAFIKASVPLELLPSVHIFWAMHEGPPPDVGPTGGEALVLIRAGDGREAVHVVSFVDLESAESFARFEVKRGLDVGFVIIYWAAFAQVIETPFGLRLDPPGPPDPRQWRAAAIAASHAAPAATPIRRQPAAMQAGDDYGPELKLMPETKMPEAPPRPARETEPAAAPMYAEVEEPEVVAEMEPVEAIAEPAPELAEPEPEPVEIVASEDPEAQVIHEPEPVEAAAEEPAPVFEEPQVVEAVSEVEDVTAEDEQEVPPAEVMESHDEVVVHLETPIEELRPADELEPASQADYEDAEEVVVPPEFATEPEQAVASTNGHHAEDPIPEEFRIDAPVSSTEGDEEVAERLLTEALGDAPASEEPAAPTEPDQLASEPVEAVADLEPAADEAPPVEPSAEVEPPKRKKAKAAASAKGRRSGRDHKDDDEDDEEEIIPVDVNEVVEKTLRVKRWTKQEEPFKGFDSPPGRF